MSQYRFYIHGNPNGQKIWGPQENQDYIAGFYERDRKQGINTFTQIDICGGDTYYTYVRSNNVLDAGGRPGSFFAMTVSFRRAYCTNVALLQRLFEALYIQICLKSILRDNGVNVQYAVSDFESAIFQSGSAVAQLRDVAVKKIQEEIAPWLKALPESVTDTFAQPKKFFNTKEVDSPLFIDDCLHYSVIVSPEVKTSSSQLQKVKGELRFALDQNSQLEETRNRLDSQVRSLSEETLRLSEELQNASARARSQYEQHLAELQQQVERSKAERDAMASERDSLRRKLTEAGAALGSMEVSFQELTRLMAGRFPESSRQNAQGYSPAAAVTSQNLQAEPPYGNTDSAPVRRGVPAWRRWLNTALLLIVILISCFILYFVSAPAKPAAPQTSENPDTTITEEPVDIAHGDDGSGDDPYSGFDWVKDYRIDISGDGSVKRDMEYTLTLIKRGTKEAFSDGSWMAIIGDSATNLSSNSLYISKATPKGTSVKIIFLVNGQEVLSREENIE